MRTHDLVIIGAGSGNSIIGPEHDDLDIAMVERGLFGGTCMNVGLSLIHISEPTRPY